MPSKTGAPNPAGGRADIDSAVRGMELFLGIYVVFTLISIVFFQYIRGPVTLFNPNAGDWSILLNVAGCLAVASFAFINRLAKKLDWNRHRIFLASLRCLVAFALLIWLGHVHLSGSQNTILAMLIPATCMVVMWFLGPRESWMFFSFGTMGLIALFFLERKGRLEYFPLYSNGDGLRHPFMSWWMILFNFSLYLAISFSAMTVLSRIYRDLQRKSADLMEASKKLEQQAFTDFLTGLMNRRAVMPLARLELERAEREMEEMAVIMTDLDDFKSVNDTYGHAAGDLVLREFTSVLRHMFRPYDLKSRIGGEEFFIVLPKVGLEQGMALADRVRAFMESNPIALDDGHSITVTASFGVAGYEVGDNETAEGLLKRADEAMYEAKRTGKNRVCAASRPAEQYNERIRL